MLMLSSAYLFVDVSEDTQGVVVNQNGIPYTSHAPIRIDSNADFDAAHGVVNWATGNGTVWNPWIIEGWEINGSGYGFCIYIGNTTEYVVVNDNDLYAPWRLPLPDQYFPWANIALYNTQYVTITNHTIINDITNSRCGVYVHNSFYNEIHHNNVTCSPFGIYLIYSNLNNVTENHCYANTLGIYIRFSDNNTIASNLLPANRNNGLYLFYSNGNIILDNSIHCMKGAEGQNGQSIAGMWVRESHFNTIELNEIFNITGGDATSTGGYPGSGYGIQLEDSSNNTILENTIYDIKSGEYVFFRDDMESGSDQWEHSSTVMLVNGEIPLEYFYDTELDTDIISDWNNTASVGVEWTDATFHSFNSSYFINETNNNKSAVTETVNFLNLQWANLSFWQKYNLTAGENGGFLQVGYKDPAVGGVSDWDWKYIAPAAYTGNLNASAQVNDSFGTPITDCWNGISSGTLGWEFIGIDILGYVPAAYRDEVRIKLNYTYLGGVGTGGWYLDDVRLTISRVESNPLTADDKDVWNLTDAMAHSGSHCWSNVDPVTGYMKPGIDNYLTTKPIDITSAKNISLSAYLKFNINEDSGAPPDGFRVELTRNGGVSWVPINFGVRSGWGVSGTGQDIDDGQIDGKAYTGLPESGDPIADDYWVNASSMTRINTNLTSFSGNIIQLRFRVTNSNNVTYEHNNNHNQPDPGFGGFYIDDVEVKAESIFTPPDYSKAISLSDSYNNSIYHNNFLNDGANAEDDGVNFWDNGYPSGGNFWDDYSGSDIFSGPNQDLPGSDGFGDTNYTNILSGANVDEYPLVGPFELLEFNIPLQQGWNLISLPYIQADESIDKVLKSIEGKWNIIMLYDPLDVGSEWGSNATFKPPSLNDFDTMNHRTGYWIHVIEPNVTLTVTGSKPASTYIPLYAGWNLVGYPSLTNETVGNALFGTGADTVMVWDPSEPYNIREVGPTHIMRPSEGYWVHGPMDSYWIVDW